MDFEAVLLSLMLMAFVMAIMKMFEQRPIQIMVHSCTNTTPQPAEFSEDMYVDEDEDEDEESEDTDSKSIGASDYMDVPINPVIENEQKKFN